MPSSRSNPAFGLAMNRLGARDDPYAAFNFLIEIEDLLVGGFSEVSGLQFETEIQDYREGGQNAYLHRLAGPIRYPQNLILKHGLTDSDTLWSWMQEVAQGPIKRRNGTIYLLDQQGNLAIQWIFIEAYPVKWSGPEFRAETNTIAFETIELVHRGLSRPTAINR